MTKRTEIKWGGNFTVDRPQRTAKRKNSKKRHAKSDWEPYKELIYQLYYEEEKKLEDVRNCILEQTGFDASVAQYRHALEDWGDGAKYQKVDPLQRIQARQLLAKRAEQGKTKHAYKIIKTGEVLNAKKFEHSLKRYKNRDAQILISIPQSPKIDVVTPRSIVPSPDPCLSPNHIQSPLLRISKPNSPTAYIDIDSRIMLSPFQDQTNVISPTAMMEKDLADLVYVDTAMLDKISDGLPSTLDNDPLYSQNIFPRPLVDLQDQTRVNNSTVGPMGWNSPNVVLDERIEEMIRCHTIANVTKTREWHNAEYFILQPGGFPKYRKIILAELPFFNFTKAHVSEAITKSKTSRCQSSPINVPFTNPPWFSSTAPLLDQSNRSVDIASKMLSGLFNTPVLSASIPMDTITSIISCLGSMIPHRYLYELESQLHDKPNLRAGSPLQAIFEIAVFYGSNNLSGKVWGILRWIRSENHIAAFKAFLCTKSATTRAFLRGIKFQACQIGDVSLFQSLPFSKADFNEILRTESFPFNNAALNKFLLSHCSKRVLSGSVGASILIKVVRNDDYIWIAEILLQHNTNVNYKQKIRDLTIALFIAAKYRQLKMMHFLLAHGANVNLAVYFSYRQERISGTIFPYIIEVACAELEWDDQEGIYMETIKVLLNAGAYPGDHTKCSDILNYTWGRNDLLYQLLSQYCNKDCGSLSIQLAEAACDGMEVFKALYDEYEESEEDEEYEDISQEDLMSALELLVRKSRTRLEALGIATLLEFDIDMDDVEFSKSLLETVISPYVGSDSTGGLDTENALEILRLLFDANFHVDVESLVEILDDHEDLDLALWIYIIEKGLNMPKDGERIIEYAVKWAEEATTCDREVIEPIATLFKKGLPIDAIGDRFNLLQAAAFQGQLNVVEYLVHEGADVNFPAKMASGETALQAACLSGNCDVILFLLDNGAKVNSKPSRNGHTELEGILEASEVLPPSVYANNIGNNGKGSRTRSGIIYILLDHGADPLSNGGGCPGSLNMLVSRDMPALLTEFLKKGADPNWIWEPKRDHPDYESHKHLTPLQLAAEENKKEILELLMEFGADINCPAGKRYGRTALQAVTSVSPSNINMVKYLIEKGAEVNAPAGPYGGITAMQGAAISGSITVAEYLLTHNADINAGPSLRKGRTAIEGAAEHGRLDMVQWLLNHGATGRQTDGYRTAIQLAETEGHIEIVEILQRSQLERDMHEQLGDFIDAVAAQL